MTGMTLDQLKHLTDMLSPADKARLIDDLTARLATEIASTEAQESPLYHFGLPMLDCGLPCRASPCDPALRRMRNVQQEMVLGQRLRSIRAEIVASGAPLLDRTSLAAEVAERRGER